MATIIIVLIVILGAVTGGVYYYETMSDRTPAVTQIANKSQIDYLSDMLITPEKVFKIFNEYFKNVAVEEKVKQYGVNNVMRIINIKFSGVRASGVVSPVPHTLILQSALFIVKDNSNIPSAKKGVVEEYINSKGIRVSIVKRGDTGKLVLSPVLNVMEKFRAMRAEGQKVEQSSESPYEPTVIYAYVNNGKVMLYSTSTLSFINVGQGAGNERKFLHTLLNVLRKVRSDVQREQAEAINNLPETFSN